MSSDPFESPSSQRLRYICGRPLSQTCGISIAVSKSTGISAPSLKQSASGGQRISSPAASCFVTSANVTERLDCDEKVRNKRGETKLQGSGLGL
jgi:hypothetical protein